MSRSWDRGAIVREAETEREIMGLFDLTTYGKVIWENTWRYFWIFSFINIFAKGGAVVKMMKESMGDDDFYQALQDYQNKNKYFNKKQIVCLYLYKKTLRFGSVLEPDLFEAFDKVFEMPVPPLAPTPEPQSPDSLPKNMEEEEVEEEVAKEVEETSTTTTAPTTEEVTTTTAATTETEATTTTEVPPTTTPSETTVDVTAGGIGNSTEEETTTVTSNTESSIEESTTPSSSSSNTEQNITQPSSSSSSTEEVSLENSSEAGVEGTNSTAGFEKKP